MSASVESLSLPMPTVNELSVMTRMLPSRDSMSLRLPTLAKRRRLSLTPKVFAFAAALVMLTADSCFVGRLVSWRSDLPSVSVPKGSKGFRATLAAFTRAQDDPFAVLGVSPGSTPIEIKSAYKRSALQVHPDVNDAADARQEFQEITKAFKMLSNPTELRRWERVVSTRSGQRYKRAPHAAPTAWGQPQNPAPQQPPKQKRTAAEEAHFLNRHWGYTPGSTGTGAAGRRAT